MKWEDIDWKTQFPLRSHSKFVVMTYTMVTPFNSSIVYLSSSDEWLISVHVSKYWQLTLAGEGRVISLWVVTTSRLSVVQWKTPQL